MALQPCSECKAEISDKAASCPHCGAPVTVSAKPYERAKATKEGVWGLIGLLIFVVVIWKSCGSDPAPTSAVPAIPAATGGAPKVSAAQAVEATPPLEPSHNFSLEDHGEYGYESALSDDDNKAGVTAKPLIMAKFLGDRNGTLSAAIQDGSRKSIFSCKRPCDFVKVDVFFGGEKISTQRVKNTPGSIMNGILEDAMSGQLDVFQPPAKRGKTESTE